MRVFSSSCKVWYLYYCMSLSRIGKLKKYFSNLKKHTATTKFAWDRKSAFFRIFAPQPLTSKNTFSTIGYCSNPKNDQQIFIFISSLLYHYN